MGLSAKDDLAVQSLPLLQDRIKKNPEAYRDEFKMQFEHFQSSLDIFATSPQRPEKSFHELVMFIAHTVPYYSSMVEVLTELLITTLNPHHQIIHPLSRRTIVNALLLLRGKQSISLLRLLPLIFELLDLPNKSLRQLLLNFVCRDIAKNKLLRGGPQKDQLQRFLLEQLQAKSESRCNHATRLVIDLYRRDAWKDPRVVNVLSGCCFSPYKKVALAAVSFMLGKVTPLVDDGEDSSDEEKSKPHLPIGSKKTKGKARKFERAKEAAKRKEERKIQRQNTVFIFTGSGIIDALHDPQTFADHLYNRVISNKQKDTLQLKLAFLNLISRLIGRYQLIMFNFYPLLQRYINPKQKQVTHILAILAQASHELVPPEELRGVIRCVMDLFIADYQSPEVMAVGLNAVREVCMRAPLALSEDMLADLAEFRRYKNNSVVAGARSLINLYRDIYPDLLHRRLRGKSAAIEVSAEKAFKPEYGQVKVATSIPGLELLKEGNTTESKEYSKDNKEQQIDSDDHDDEEEEWIDEDLDTLLDDDGEERLEDDDGEERLEDVNINGRPQKRRRLEDIKEEDTRHNLDPTETLLTDRDFKRLRKLQRRKGNGRSKDDSLVLSSDDGSDSEDGIVEDSDVVRPESLASGIKKKGKDYRISLMQKGRKDRITFAEKNKERSRLKKGSLPNNVQSRNKPLMMVKHKRAIKAKKHFDVATKLSNLRQHIKTIKMDTGKKKKYRRN